MNSTLNRTSTGRHLAELICAIALLALLTFPAAAQKTYPFSYAATSATNRAVVIITPDRNPIGSGIARLNYLLATNDLAGSSISIYRPGAPKTISAASSGATNRVLFASPTGNDFATSNQVCLLRRKATSTSATDSWERLVSFTNTATSVTFTTASGGAVAIGDEVYICTLHTSLPVGATATKEYAFSIPIYNGEEGRPVLVESAATTLGKLPLVTGWWEVFNP